jgi:cell division protein FtsB
MNLRLGLRQIRVLPSSEARLRSLTQGADHAEALAIRMRSKAEPYVQKLFFLRTRVATAGVSVLAVWLFMHILFGANGMVVYRSKRAEYQALRKQIDQLQSENDAFSNRVNELKNDPKSIEKEAREQFHYARPGEVIYVSPEHSGAPQQSTRTASK